MIALVPMALAAIALSSPLEHRLRNAVRQSLTQTVPGEIGDYASLHESHLSRECPATAR